MRYPAATILLVAIGLHPAANGADDEILAILKSNCAGCHNDRGKTSGFSVDSLESVMVGGNRRGPAVVAGNPEKSPLIQLLRGQIAPKMPLGKALPDSEIAVIEKWIRELKPNQAVQTSNQRYWAFVKPEKPEPPKVAAADWVRNPIDNFVLSKLEEKGLKPAPEASRTVLIRRVYYDLIGLPPTPEEIKAFVSDKSPKAYEELIDRLLASPRYGERWARHWLDLARYADTNGYEGDPEFPYAWRYRDYVTDAFNNDKPYDQFIKEQLAGDELTDVNSAGALPSPDPEGVVALTFLRLAPFTEPRGEESRDILLSEMTSTASSVFLGMTVGCAKCHNHKYDQIPTRDFYRMKAFFASVYIERSLPGDVQQLGGPQPAEFYKPQQKEWADKKREAYQKELVAAELALDQFAKPLLVKLAAVKKAEAEKGKAEKAAKAEKTEKPETPEATPKPLTLKDLKRALDTDGNNALSLVHKDETFTENEKLEFARLAERILRLKNAITRLEPLAMSLRNADDPPYGPVVPPTYVQIRGEFDNHGEAVQPGFLSAITGNSDPAVIPIDRYKRHPNRNRRATLAKWIASADNPLTARVMVNRLWQHHFGRGIVETPSDFGKNGGSPSHPELLDWLATRFIEEKWSIKAMHRVILNSSAYRQGSAISDEKTTLKLDPDNRLLWRFPRLRLEGDVIRDAVLAVSGRLNLEGGGPPVYPPLPRGLDEAQRVQNVNTWETSDGPDGRKRSIYVFQRRSLNLPLLETFDAEVQNATCDRRRRSVTALQALAMYDGEFVNTEARYLAERVHKEVGPDLNEQVQRAFQITLGRSPSAIEQQKVSAFLKPIAAKDDALIGVCRVLLNSNEFIYLD
jgi:hypothetical protein